MKFIGANYPYIYSIPNEELNSILGYDPSTKLITYRSNTEFISDLGLVTSAQLGNYLPLSGGTLTGGGRIRDNGNIYIQQVNVGGNATGLFWETMDDSAFTAGIGAYTENGNFYWHYLGWGAYPWSTATSLAVGDNIFTYKDYQIYHAGNVDKFIFGINGSGTIEGYSPDLGLPDNSFKPKKSGFYRPNNDNDYGELLMWVNHTYYINDGTYGAGIVFDYGGINAWLTGIDGAGNKTPNRKIWTSGDFNPNNYWNKYFYGGYTGINTNDDFAILNNDQAQRLLTNGLLVSSNYTDRQYIPNQGIFSIGTIATNSRLQFTENAIGKWHIESIGGEFNLVETGVSQRFRISPNASTPTYNDYGLWHAGNFNPGNYLTNRGNWHNALLAKTDNPNSVTEYADDPSITGFKSYYGTSLHVKGNGPWHNRLDFNTNGRLDWWQGINTTDMTYKGQIAVIADGVENWTSANFNPNTKVNKSGDTMTGDLTVPNLALSSNFISSYTLNGSQILAALVDTMYVGNGILDYLVFQSKYELTHYQNGVAGTIWTTHNFNPDNKVSKSGDTMTGGLTVTTPDSIGSGNLGTLPTNLKLFLSNGTQYGTVFWTEGTGQGYIQQQRADGNPVAYRLNLQPYGGELFYGNSEVANHWWVNSQGFITQNNVPVATNNIVGGIRLITDTKSNIAPQAVTTVTDRSYAIQLNNNNQAVVNVPWIDPTTLGYATQSWVDNVLTDYAHKADANTFTKVNTFDLSPRVPAGVNGSDAVNVAQLFEVAATQAVETVNSKFITEMMNTTFAAFDMSGMGYPTILTVIAKSDGELRVEEVKDGRSVKVRNVSSGNLEVRINGGTTTIVSANTWADYHSDGSGDITMTSQAGCYII